MRREFMTQTARIQPNVDNSSRRQAAMTRRKNETYLCKWWKRAILSFDFTAARVANTYNLFYTSRVATGVKVSTKRVLHAIKCT